MAENLSALFQAIQAAIFPLKYDLNQTSPEARRAKFIAYWEANDKEISKTRQLVEDEFRTLLGSADK